MRWHEWGERNSRVKTQGKFYINEISPAERERWAEKEVVWKWDGGKRGRETGSSENVRVAGKEIKM